MCGRDLTTIDGIGDQAAIQIVSEIGIDMSKWPTEKHFVSWLCLCPELNKSGGKQQKKRKSKTQSSTRVVQYCGGAQSLFNSKCSCMVVVFEREMAAVAVTAMARKLAIIVYKMLRDGRPYVDRGAEYYDDRYRERQIRDEAAHHQQKNSKRSSIVRTRQKMTTTSLATEHNAKPYPKSHPLTPLQN